MATAEMVRERAQSLTETLKPLAQEAERLRRVPDESMRLVKQAGLLRVTQPKAWGGYELGMRSHIDVIAALAEGCTATAWVAGVGHAHNWMMGHMSPEAQAEVYADDPDVLISAVIGPRGKAVRQADGSFVLNGVWPFGSGSQHAAWLIVGAQVFDESGQHLFDGDFLTPQSTIEIKDDWQVAGLQGTGSCTLVAKDVAVPAHRVLDFGGLLANRLPTSGGPDSAPLYRSQAVPVLTLCLCGTSLGAARAAMAEFIRAVQGKSVAYTGHVAHEWMANQMALGHAAALIHAAELLLYSVADTIDDYAARGEEMSLELRARMRADCSMGVRLCREAVEKLYTNVGASGLSLKSPIQRAAKDLQAMNMHGLLLLDPATELYGRILLGLEPNTPVI